MNPEDAAKGLKIQLNNGDPCPSGSDLSYQTTFSLICKSDMKNGEIELISANFDKDRCENSFVFNTKEACPKVNFYVVWEFINKFSIIFGAVLILIGIFETFYGAKVMIVTIFLATCMATVTFVFIFLFQFIIPSGGNPNIVWVVLVISIIVGIIIGYIVSKNNKIVIGMILGGYMGYIIGVILYDSMFIHIHASPKVKFIWIILINFISLFSGRLLVNYYYIHNNLCYCGLFPYGAGDYCCNFLNWFLCYY